MDGQGYETIRGDLKEKGIDASFGPHLFEGEETRAFHIEVPHSEDDATEVVSTVEASSSDVRLSKGVLSKDGRTANYSFVDGSVPANKAPDGDEYEWEVDDHDFDGEGTPYTSVNVIVPEKLLTGSGLRGAQYALDIYPTNADGTKARPDDPAIKHAVYAAYDNVVISIEGSVRKATLGHGGDGFHPNRVPEGANAYEFFNNPPGENPPLTATDIIPVEVWEKLEEIYVAAHGVATTQLQAFDGGYASSNPKTFDT